MVLLPFEITIRIAEQAWLCKVRFFSTFDDLSYSCTKATIAIRVPHALEIMADSVGYARVPVVLLAKGATHHVQVVEESAMPYSVIAERTNAYSQPSDLSLTEGIVLDERPMSGGERALEKTE
jgi:hypothetical protein